MFQLKTKTKTVNTTIRQSISNDRIYFYLDVLNETQNDIKWTTQKRAYLELALVKMIDHQTIDRINANEN